MSTIYLIRHGQASFGQDDYDKLSDLGVQQAQVLGKSFQQRQLTVDNLVRGDMLRHQQTQDNCLAQLTQNIGDGAIDKRWNEFDHQQVLAAFDERFSVPSKMMSHFKAHESTRKLFSFKPLIRQ